MNLWLLKPGHRIRTRDGAEAEVLSGTEDGVWIKVRYLEVEDDTYLAGTENLVSEGEVEALLGVAGTAGCGEKITVILHHILESEESEESYDAIMMKDVP